MPVSATAATSPAPVSPWLVMGVESRCADWVVQRAASFMVFMRTTGDRAATASSRAIKGTWAAVTLASTMRLETALALATPDCRRRLATGPAGESAYVPISTWRVPLNRSSDDGTLNHGDRGTTARTPGTLRARLAADSGPRAM